MILSSLTNVLGGRLSAVGRLSVMIAALALTPMLLTPASAQTVDTFAIAYGDTISDGVPGAGAGNLEAAGAQDAYTFTGAAGEQAILDVLSGSLTTFRWKMSAPSGAVLFDGLYVDRQVTLAETGVHTITVYGFSGTSTGVYSFRLLLTPPPQNFAISIGDTVSDGVPAAGAGNLEAPGAQDVYTFSGTAGQEVVFDVLSGNAGQIGWRLNAPDGTVLFDTVLGDRQQALAQTGTYTLTLRGNTITNIGAYSFRLLLVPVPQNFAISIGDTVSDGVPAAGAGNLEAPGAQDVYTFSGTAGQSVIFDVLSGNAGQIGWRLNAPDGTVLFDTVLGDRQQALTQTGVYTLTLRGNAPASSGIYSFRLLLVPAPQNFAISIGDTVSDGVPAAGAGNLEAAGALDIYTFSGTAGQEVVFDVLSGNAGQIGWRLNAPDGTVLFDAILGDRQQALAQTGTYTLTLRGNAPASSGTYSFSVLLVLAPQNFAISIGDTVSDGVPAAGAGSLEAPGALDIYTFSGTAGQEVVFDVLSGNAGQIGWRLNAPDGTVLFDSILADHLVPLSQTGTYTLTLRGNTPASFGTYSFSLALVPPLQTFNISLGDTVSLDVPAAGAGNLEAAGAIDRYLFSATAGQWVFVEALAGNATQIGWRLNAPDGTALFDTILADHLVQLGQTGTYTLTLRGNTPASYGAYSFTLWQQDTFGLAFSIQPPASAIAGELFIVQLQVVDPTTQEPRPLEGVAITLNLIDDATGLAIPGFSWSGTSGMGGILTLSVSVNTPGVYRLRTDASGYSPVDSAAFEVTGISSSGGAYLPDLMLNGDAGGT